MTFSHNLSKTYTVFEICAGGGGQALGLEYAGFDLIGASEIEPDACETLRINRPGWEVIEGDIRHVKGQKFKGIDLLAGGVPCPPFSIAGKQLGAKDERDLFPEALRLVKEINPKAVMLENVRGFADKRFKDYRKNLFDDFKNLGYKVTFNVLNASDYGVPQLRPRFIMVALKEEYVDFFIWPKASSTNATVSETIGDLMLSDGWDGGTWWLKRAKKVAPTIVGGSKKHGGPDLGPTRAKRQWVDLGVDGKGIANHPPGSDFPVDKLPRLTLRMVARLQGFPDSWSFHGGKTSAYRQIGNAFPAPVAHQVGIAIVNALNKQSISLKPSGQNSFFKPFSEVCAT